MSNTILATPLTLPSGVVLQNRLVKGAMAEQFADANNNPSDPHILAYREWSTGGWGGLLTGNVDVSTKYMGGYNDVALSASPNTATIESWHRWVAEVQAHNTPGIVQLVHAGRQSWPGAKRSFFEKSIAPSPTPLVTGPGILERLMSKMLWGTPREMTIPEIKEAVQQFARAAKFVHEAGFKGIELHGAHGYLITQFLSSKINFRTDEYGGTPAKRARFLIEVIRAIRAVVPATFAVGVKFNSADVGGQESLEENLEQLGLVVAEQVDFIEISGGTYENMRMGGPEKPKAERTIEREAFFLDYASIVRERFPKVILMVTGGFRTRRGMIAALESGACDIVGVGRPATVWPHLVKDIILNDEVGDDDANVVLPPIHPPWLVRQLGIKMINNSADTMHHVVNIGLMGEGKKPIHPSEKA
ncbi:unnamed protein product [Periconia digitata]|uniref:NADH:flavin oxidoreductase/NADH oxidase N-terminal domain-containing protein n=1 Tax=Periconia digitata TaxID=1303443 RepID=A0A9W4XHX1_9PLEO|nr:unnamed protein product [Periconia digitata]